MAKKIHIIGIGGIGVSALARYYHYLGYEISGTDSTDSVLIQTLRNEGMNIFIGEHPGMIDENIEKIIYSEAIITKPDLPAEDQIYAHPELQKARELGIPHFSYPVALGEVFNQKKGIAITGSHGKSTTTAMMAIVLAGSEVGGSAIIGTQVPQLGGTNFHAENSENFVIEACEYKRSFLKYRPFITIITNIDLDHLDYYKNLDDYISAFQSLISQTSGFVIISESDENSLKLQIPQEKKIVVGEKISYFAKVEMLETDEIFYEAKTLEIPEISLQIPGEHILQDARLVFAASKLLGLQDEYILQKLASYSGSWRRSEIIRTTKNGNILMSDYGHHPNEIRPTLTALKSKFPEKKLFVAFQPHQYSRTRELLPEFSNAFADADILVIPNIYFSRDKQEDVEWMTTERLIDAIAQNHSNVINGNGLDNTLKMIQQFDEQNPNSAVILLLGAGDIDALRSNIL
ncbi:UDP-N-acetylmuramate--L-alanine ligase [Candidatus Gracilibacteria bacterium]|nr:UDP-N-acetylmuramate--L-alanine ligase [Candidatus Gracilibacteria bacterium]